MPANIIKGMVEPQEEKHYQLLASYCFDGFGNASQLTPYTVTIMSVTTINLGGDALSATFENCSFGSPHIFHVFT